MPDDTCGHPTNDGGECSNPAGENGRCWQPTHNPDSDADDPGRPSKFQDRKDDVLEVAKQGATMEGCARAAGIHHSTLYDWLEKNEEFSEEFRRARAEGEQQLLEGAWEDDPKWVLERSYGYVKTERREVEHGTGDGPLMVIREGGDE